MGEQTILVLDAGTTSTRAVLFSPDGERIYTEQSELIQYYPQPGWVEQDAEEIWKKTLCCAQRAVEFAGGADTIAAIGITNQRETVVAWDRRSGRSLTRAIVWQDRRTADVCQRLREEDHESLIQSRTGLIIDPYFSATKMRWLLDNVPEIRDAGPNLAFGTVESWLVWKLTNGLHVSDASNASRTQLSSLAEGDWDGELCTLFGVDARTLPEIVDSAGRFGESAPELLGSAIPICGLSGDQQAATIGQGCLSVGDTKATYGTGAFILTNMGKQVPSSGNRLLGTLLYQIEGQRHYALEGSIFAAGSLVKWLRDQLGVIRTAEETEDLICSVPDSGGVFMLPGLVGLGAPHWRPDVKGMLIGLSMNSTAAHIVRATLESLAHQAHDLATAFLADGAQWQAIRIDGGMSSNDWIAQDLADLVEVPVERPEDVETTARGAAMLAAVGSGLYTNLQEAARMCSPRVCFDPKMQDDVRQARLNGWAQLLRMM